MTSVSARVDVGSSTETSSGSTTHVRSTRYGSFPSSVSSSIVTRDDVLQSPEEAIPVPGDARVAVRPRLCRVLDVTDGAVERAVVGAGEHGHFESNFRDSEHREWRGAGSLDALRQALAPNRGPSDWSGVPGCAATDLERREAIQIVPVRGRDPDMERHPNRQADKADRPAHSLGERHEPATHNCHGGQLQSLNLPEADKGENGRIQLDTTGGTQVPASRRAAGPI